MDKKILLIGAGVVIAGGAIATGMLLKNDSNNNPFDIPLGQESSRGSEEKIEQLYFDELRNKERYAFCIGKEEIKGIYKNSVYGNEEGFVDYNSDDISVFDKEDNKLYILGRKIKYEYSGSADVSNQAGQGSMEINEGGAVTEYYKKAGAPVRIDYNSKIINPAPERKNKDWVLVTIKSIGTVMGLTQERTDEEKGDAKVFCSNFSLQGNPLENGALVTSDYFSFQKECPDYSPNPGASFSGNFTFECSNIDSAQGVELLKEYKTMEEAEKDFNSIREDDSAPQKENQELENAINGSGSGQGVEDIKGKLEDLKTEMKGDQKAQ